MLADFQTYFAKIEDPRVERIRRHELLDIIVIAICAVICSGDDWVDVEGWDNAKLMVGWDILGSVEQLRG